ncbi:cholesterol 7-desaturase-like [Pelobates cultripes]|uniref:Cholesterol 7-desaturase-like n=1 Tax=Pelobates cultripes TaxID=61616 RepID=A0AAD1WKF6_PELCU|nr:cholesterol 7-desaturase-like [Pelobates cultripes]
MIFVWFHCDGVEPTWSVPEQPEITAKEWVYRGRTEHFVNAHIEVGYTLAVTCTRDSCAQCVMGGLLCVLQEIPENAADIAHLTFLHEPGIITGTDLRYTKSRLWDFVKHTWKVQWMPEPPPNKHCSQMLLVHQLLLFGKHVPLLDFNVVARQVGPGIVFLTFKHNFLGTGVILQSVTPVEPLLQKVTHIIYYQRNIPTLIPKFMLKAECIQFERDVMVWNNKKYVSKPLLVKEDAAIQKHRRWYSQFYSENSPQFSYQQESLDW